MYPFSQLIIPRALWNTGSGPAKKIFASINKTAEVKVKNSLKARKKKKQNICCFAFIIFRQYLNAFSAKNARCDEKVM